jgi:hypothetical protein
MKKHMWCPTRDKVKNRFHGLPNITPLIRWFHGIANLISWRFQACSWTFQLKVSLWPSKLAWHVANLESHDNRPSPLATSWIFQTNFMNLFALCGSHIVNFSTSCQAPGFENITIEKPWEINLELISTSNLHKFLTFLQKSFNQQMTMLCYYLKELGPLVV